MRGDISVIIAVLIVYLLDILGLNEIIGSLDIIIIKLVVISLGKFIKLICSINLMPTSNKLCLYDMEVCDKYFMPEAFKFIVSKIPELGNINNYPNPTKYANFVGTCSKLPLKIIKNYYKSFYNQVFLCSKLEASENIKIKRIIKNSVFGENYHFSSAKNIQRECHDYKSNSISKYRDLLIVPSRNNTNKISEEIIMISSDNEKFITYINALDGFGCFNKCTNTYNIWNLTKLLKV